MSGEILRLGLIGDNIAASRAPELHVRAGRLEGRTVTYERLVPGARGEDFARTFEAARRAGFRGVNVTYPYKEAVVPLLRAADPRVAVLGAANTVLFEPAGPKGFNTDWSGFVAAYRVRFAARRAGRVCLVGAGGIGKAVAFGLLEFAPQALVLHDRDGARAEALARSLRTAAPGLEVTVSGDVAEASRDAEGIVNCTPLGMTGHPGSPVPPHCLDGPGWAFDAVYTPARTQFLKDAARAGRTCLPGTELFFHQGLHAAELFLGAPLVEADLRRALAEEGEV